MDNPVRALKPRETANESGRKLVAVTLPTIQIGLKSYS